MKIFLQNLKKNMEKKKLTKYKKPTYSHKKRFYVASVNFILKFFAQKLYFSVCLATLIQTLIRLSSFYVYFQGLSF